METIAFLGCSRGLGKQVCLLTDQVKSLDFALLAARNHDNLNELSSKLHCQNKILTSDFSDSRNLAPLVEEIKKHRVKRIFYFAGGGPYGLFHSKEWKDHLWALQVSFLTPGELLHQVLSNPELSFIEQVIFIGSLIADHKPDPNAASYASAKHGLKGMVESVLKEGCSIDLRYFRPGYMNTDLLPKNAKIRGNKNLLEPEQVAQRFVQWAFEPHAQAIFDEPNIF